jgi:hypothetical protein
MAAFYRSLPETMRAVRPTSYLLLLLSLAAGATAASCSNGALQYPAVSVDVSLACRSACRSEPWAKRRTTTTRRTTTRTRTRTRRWDGGAPNSARLQLLGLRGGGMRGADGLGGSSSPFRSPNMAGSRRPNAPTKAASNGVSASEWAQFQQWQERERRQQQQQQQQQQQRSINPSLGDVAIGQQQEQRTVTDLSQRDSRVGFVRKVTSPTDQRMKRMKEGRKVPPHVMQYELPSLSFFTHGISHSASLFYDQPRHCSRHFINSSARLARGLLVIPCPPPSLPPSLPPFLLSS